MKSIYYGRKLTFLKKGSNIKNSKIADYLARNDRSLTIEIKSESEGSETLTDLYSKPFLGGRKRCL